MMFFRIDSTIFRSKKVAAAGNFLLLMSLASLINCETRALVIVTGYANSAPGFSWVAELVADVAADAPDEEALLVADAVLAFALAALLALLLLVVEVLAP